MSKNTFILFASDTGWQAGAGESLIDIAVPHGATPDQIASASAQSLKQLGHGASSVILAIPSNWCLCATIRTDDLPKADYKSLLYRLEEKLPWPAESITADFIRHENSTLGICSKTSQIRPLIDALESHGIPIQSITPAALLAAANQSSHSAMLRIESSDHVDLLVMQHGQPIAWASASKDESDIDLQLNLLSLDLPEDLPQVKLENPQSLALRNAQQAPLINLRQHDLAAADKLRLHRRALNVLLASAAILLITLTGLFVFRSHQYQQQARQSSDQLSRAFTSHFPAWEVPGNIKAVIESEHRRLITSPSADLPPQATASAVPVLYSLLANLPPDTTMNVQHLTANADSLDLEAQLKSYEEADLIAAAARKAGLEVPPPQVRKDNNNLWSLSLHATKTKPLADAAK
jgi:type II secretory pathway component PulL